MSKIKHKHLYQLCVHLEVICRHSFSLFYFTKNTMNSQHGKCEKTNKNIAKNKLLLNLSWPPYNQHSTTVNSTRRIIFNGYHFIYDWFFYYAAQLRWQIIDYSLSSTAKAIIIYLVEMHGGIYSSLNNVKSVMTFKCSYSISLIEFSSISVRVWNNFHQFPYHTTHSHSITHSYNVSVVCWIQNDMLISQKLWRLINEYVLNGS